MFAACFCGTCVLAVCHLADEQERHALCSQDVTLPAGVCAAVLLVMNLAVLAPHTSHKSHERRVNAAVLLVFLCRLSSQAHLLQLGCSALVLGAVLVTAWRAIESFESSGISSRQLWAVAEDSCVSSVWGRPSAGVGQE